MAKGGFHHAPHKHDVIVSLSANLQLPTDKHNGTYSRKAAACLRALPSDRYTGCYLGEMLGFKIRGDRAGYQQWLSELSHTTWPCTV
jgi:hypothetical protein